jgi:23S rRNA (uracil1939-C5)-methyltransferase
MDIFTITGLGHAGDGIADMPDGPAFVPFTLPGDRVRLARSGPERARLVELVEPSPDRVKPPCLHFGSCGGCALQHVGPDLYAGWKREQVVTALRQRGFDDPPVEPVILIPAATRRRARFAWMRVKGNVLLGFQRRGSHDLIDLSQCPVLTPALWAVVEPLRAFLVSDGKRWPKGDVEVAASETGLDLLFIATPEPDRDLRVAIPTFAAAHGVARATWAPRDGAKPELLAQIRSPQLSFDGINVMPPPGVFLQPSHEGEAVLLNLVRDAVGDAKRVADLYCGLGTFALPLARGRKMRAVDGDAAAVAVLQSTARSLNLPVTAETRDLQRRPLMADDLKALDAVIFDPPRAGAPVQAGHLATSQVARVIAVSCNPATFARDARTLVDGGYKLVRVTPVDQFTWSAHVELVALFEKG